MKDNAAWFSKFGLFTDPFSPLEASSDRWLPHYLIGHNAFEIIWGNWDSIVFASAGGGKTALLARTIQACLIGKETNRPFPIPYYPPLWLYEKSESSINDHLLSICKTASLFLLVQICYKPHWFLRLSKVEQVEVYRVLSFCIGKSVSYYTQPLIETKNVNGLKGMIPQAFFPIEIPEQSCLDEFCNNLSTLNTNLENIIIPVEKKWSLLREILLSVFEFPSIYLLIDGLDSLPFERILLGKTQEIVFSFTNDLDIWKSKKIYIKFFMPADYYKIFNDFSNSHSFKIMEITWNVSLLIELIHKRIYFASRGVYGSLGAISSPDLIDLEYRLANFIKPLPREMLYIVKLIFDETLKNNHEELRITNNEVDEAIRYYKLLQ